jgi:hypothetical protein
MATSANGWTIISSTQLDRNSFPGTSIVPIPGIRKGDVATVLHYIGTQFNKNVEKLVNPGCWGYANRVIVGFVVRSNHASGTAIDLNAPKHPQFRKGTFSELQVREIRKILAFCDGVVRWGGDYGLLRKDEMHWEIVGTPAKVKLLANKIHNQGDIEMPNAKNVNDFFQVYLGKAPTASQITYYTKNSWRILAKDLLEAQKKKLESGAVGVELKPGLYKVK